MKVLTKHFAYKSMVSIKAAFPPEFLTTKFPLPCFRIMLDKKLKRSLLCAVLRERANEGRNVQKDHLLSYVLSQKPTDDCTNIEAERQTID